VSRGIALDYLSRITITDLAQRRKLFEAATASVKRAVRLAPTSGRAHSGLANQLAAGLDIAGAVREAETTLRLSPRDAINVANAGIGLAFVYPERGLATMQSSLLLDPFFFNNMSNIGRTLYGLGRLDAAFAMFEKVMLLSNGLAGSAGLATVHLLRRDAAAARRAIGPEVDGVRKLFLLAAADVLEKRPSREGSALQSLEALDPEVSGFYLARLYAWGGDTAAALTMLERAFAAGCRDLIGMLTDPFLSRLRGEPRFRALLARIFPADAIVAEERRLRTRA
jgi:tetratricopeptide (TPR) repeat protein